MVKFKMHEKSAASGTTGRGSNHSIATSLDGELDATEKKRQRRHHSRSRNGCLTCKQRHVRCDEGRPAWYVSDFMPFSPFGRSYDVLTSGRPNAANYPSPPTSAKLMVIGGAHLRSCHR
jgi:hypothetical protein